MHSVISIVHVAEVLFLKKQMYISKIMAEIAGVEKKKHLLKYKVGSLQE